MHWSEIWEGDSAWAVVVRAVLLPFSWLYGFGWRAYRSAYDLGLKKSSHPHRPIICIGSLQVGGSGKTPVTIFIAEQLREMGYEVVIGCSGYGSPASEAASIAPGGPLEASKWGDEPAMIRWLLPDIPIIVGRRRVMATVLCHQRFPSAVLLMDDGFQHLPLKKNLNVLLLSGGRNRWCLPAGPLREPLAFANRADIVIPGEFTVVPQPLKFVSSGELVDTNMEAAALCALGQPKVFFDAVRMAGLNVVEILALPDHDPLTRGNLFGTWPREMPIVVTAKDWVKLRERSDISERTIWIADYRVSVEPKAAFCGRIKQSLDEATKDLS